MSPKFNRNSRSILGSIFEATVLLVVNSRPLSLGLCNQCGHDVICKYNFSKNQGLLLTLKTSLPLKLIMKKKLKMDLNMSQENSWENTPFQEAVEWPLLFLICPQMVSWWSLHQKIYLLRLRLKTFLSNYNINHEEEEKTNSITQQQKKNTFVV